MDQTVDIQSTQNGKIKQVIKLFDRRDREKNQQFVIEGYREILRAVEKGHPIETLFYCRDFFLQKNEEALLKKIQQRAKTFSCSRSVFKKISFRDRPDGLVAVAPIRPLTLEDLSKNLSPRPLLVIVEGIEKPGNLGTILRSCDGAGVDGLIVCDRCTDLYNPNVVRASLGTLFTVPSLEASFMETIDFIQKNQIATVAASPDGKKNYTDIDMSKPIAIVLGCEQYGLSDKWRERCDDKVQIPMLGHADSLNVAQAATLMVYEAQRQRDFSIVPR
jgi:RNA methyltransferase, TrmH family